MSRYATSGPLVNMGGSQEMDITMVDGVLMPVTSGEDDGTVEYMRGIM